MGTNQVNSMRPAVIAIGRAQPSTRKCLVYRCLVDGVRSSNFEYEETKHCVTRAKPLPFGVKDQDVIASAAHHSSITLETTDIEAGPSLKCFRAEP
eukprot:3868388-Amphidinium_carterae.1